MQSVRQILQNAAAATGDGSVMGVEGAAALGVQITGIFTATVTFEVSIDGATWVAVTGKNLGTGARATTATAAGIYTINVAAYAYFRARLTWTSGTSITATALASPESGDSSDTGGASTTIAAPLDRKADAASVSTALSIEDVAILGATNETAPATDTAPSGLNGRLQRIAQRVTSLIALLPAALGAGGGLKVDGSGTALPVSQSGAWTAQIGNTQNTTPILTSPLTFTVDVTLTRPADTTAYAINDEVTDTGGAIRTITGAARVSGGMVRLISASCIDTSAVAVRPQIAAFLFDTTSTPATDNAAFAPTDGVLNTFVGVLPFNIWYLGDDTAGATGNAVSPYLGPPLEMKTAGSANLFLRVKIYNAYVPTSGEIFTFRLVFAQY